MKCEDCQNDATTICGCGAVRCNEHSHNSCGHSQSDEHQVVNALTAEEKQLQPINFIYIKDSAIAKIRSAQSSVDLMQRMLDAAADASNNNFGYSSDIAALSDFASEYANSECTVDDKGDVWDCRGHWWTDERKEQFLAWLAAR